MSETEEEIGWMHIYPQRCEHDDVRIVGNVKALKDLRDAIDEALKIEHKDQQSGAYVIDGEGYSILIQIRGKDTLISKGTPYSISRQTILDLIY